MSDTESKGFAGTDDFFGADLTKYDTVVVEGIAAPVRVRGLRSDEFTRLQEKIEGKGKANYLSLVVTMGAVREDGGPLFQLEQQGKVSALPLHVTSPIAGAIMRLSGTTKEEQQTLEDKSSGEGE
jgi:hypothetical protein